MGADFRPLLVRFMVLYRVGISPNSASAAPSEVNLPAVPPAVVVTTAFRPLNIVAPRGAIINKLPH